MRANFRRNRTTHTKKNCLKPWKEKTWCIPKEGEAAFVCNMEDVLEVYERPYDADYPVVCIDEGSKTLEGSPVPARPARPRRPKKVDYSYEKKGLANIFMHFEPLTGRFAVKVTEQKTAEQWANDMRRLADDEYPRAKKIITVLDNLSTHSKASFYKVWPPAEARRLAERFEFHYTPKHGSWLNMAEIGLCILKRECLRPRVASKDELARHIAAWLNVKNAKPKTIDWRFRTQDARIKLKYLYPVLTCQEEAVA